MALSRADWSRWASSAVQEGGGDRARHIMKLRRTEAARADDRQRCRRMPSRLQRWWACAACTPGDIGRFPCPSSGHIVQGGGHGCAAPTWAGEGLVGVAPHLGHRAGAGLRQGGDEGQQGRQGHVISLPSNLLLPWLHPSPAPAPATRPSHHPPTWASTQKPGWLGMNSAMHTHWQAVSEKLPGGGEGRGGAGGAWFGWTGGGPWACLADRTRAPIPIQHARSSPARRR